MFSRRDFIHAGCIAGLATLVPPIVDRAEAYFPHGAGSSFNRGRSQTNLNYIQQGGSYAFLNALKTAQNFALADGSAWPDPSQLDTDGYPLAAVNAFGGVTTVFDVPTQTARAGNYVVYGAGNGSVDFSGNLLTTATFTGVIDAAGVLTASSVTNTIYKGMDLVYAGSTLYQAIVGDQLTGTAGGAGTYLVIGVVSITSRSMSATSGSKSSSGGKLRCLLAPTAARMNFNMSSIGSPNLNPLAFCHVDDESRLRAGEVFGVKFKQRLLEAKFGVIRFLNWQLCNVSNVTSWATRKPISHWSYNAYEFRASLYAGATSNSGAAFSVSFPGFVLADKATVIVKFTSSFSGAITMNVAGTGAKTVLNHYSQPINDPSWYPIGGTYQSIATLVYDAKLDAYIKTGGDASRQSVGLDSGCPPELLLRLCAEVGAHPYFVTPHLTADPLTDYMPSLMAYCRDNSPAWMIPRFEGPNETWNNFGGFYATPHFIQKALAYWGTSDYNEMYGKAISVLGQAASAIFGGNRSKYHLICGVKTATGDTLGDQANSNPRMEAGQYIGQAAAAQSPLVGSFGTITFTKSAANSWVTHVATAQYYTPSEYGTPQESTDADAYVAAAGNPTLQASIADAYAATAGSGSGANRLAISMALQDAWKTWAKSYGINKMCGYEGGNSPDLGAGGNIDVLRGASKMAPSVGPFTTTNYNHFVGLTDGTFTAEFPSNYLLSGRTPIEDGWSVLDDIWQSPNPAQWDAIVAFNA